MSAAALMLGVIGLANREVLTPAFACGQHDGAGFSKPNARFFNWRTGWKRHHDALAAL